ncbi:MAG TPA: MarR family transcriptional regulator [Phycisphaerales bacterium]|nr:MarR family transcriptional regulator [Phycisphaerales bacterium]
MPPRNPQLDAPVRGLAAEINKKRPFDLPEQEAWLNLLRTLSVLAEPVERMFKEHGLSEATYNALRILRGSGQAGRACSEIGRDMVTRVPDVTRIVDRLEKEGWATRCRVPEDRRVVLIKITEKGLALLARLDEPIRQLHKRQFAGLTKAEVQELSRLLEKVRGSAGENASQ